MIIPQTSVYAVCQIDSIFGLSKIIDQNKIVSVFAGQSIGVAANVLSGVW